VLQTTWSAWQGGPDLFEEKQHSTVAFYSAHINCTDVAVNFYQVEAVCVRMAASRVKGRTSVYQTGPEFGD
jgi:hypothetical protein